MSSENFYSKLQQHFREELPFVVYRKPLNSEKGIFSGKNSITENHVIALLQSDSQLHKVDDFEEKGFVFAPFDDHKSAILIPLDSSEKSKILSEEDNDKPEENNEQSEKRTVKNYFSAEEKQNHLSLIKKGIFLLNSGVLEKVVLSRKENIPLKNKNPLALFRNLEREYPTAFVYCWYHPKVGLWLGASPEVLLKSAGKRFFTMALAGTQKYSGNIEVRWGEKEKQEQQFVTDSILESIKNNIPVGNENAVSVQKSDVFTTKAGNLLHLRTDISGVFSTEKDFSNLIKVLHPTPAVCGLPKETAKKFILEEENYDREFYTGFIGELNFQEEKRRSGNRKNVENLAYRTVEKKSSFYVNLRCMQLKKEHAELYIGGGITKDSVPEDEWQETVDKAQTMKKVLLK